ncbi:MAG: hypothetical protein ACTSPA_10970 [Promethearchaeota archaeon]
MAYLEISYHNEEMHRKKEFRVISVEEICGNHIKVKNVNIRERINQLVEKNKTYHSSNKFTVISPNLNDITITNGKSNWILLKGIKSTRKQINILLLGKMIWGIEISSGLRLKASVDKHGKEKIANYLEEKVQSIFNEPAAWQEVQFYYR